MNKVTSARPGGSTVGGGTRAWLMFTCCVVIGFYGWKSNQYLSELGNRDAATAYYNLLVQGFESGQLNLKTEVPEGLKALKDPYNPDLTLPYRKYPYAENRLHDTTYYRGKIYLYFGIAPALTLFWPYHLLTGHFVSHQHAVASFLAFGFLCQVALLWGLWRRYFPSVRGGVMVGCVLALGLANSAPPVLSRPDVWEVAISAGYAFFTLALLLVWRSLDDLTRTDRWLAAASLALGLAIAARPSFLVTVPVLLLPVFRRWKARETGGAVARSLLFAAIPITTVVAGLMLYNYLRFENPFEFGQRYQLAGDRQDTIDHFSWRHVAFNARLYFVSFAELLPNFPFVGEVTHGTPPTGHGAIEWPYGILSNTPITLFAAFIPWAMRGSDTKGWTTLRWFCVSLGVAVLFSAFVVCSFYVTSTRYQLEIHPVLVILACVAICAVHERVAADRSRSLVFGAAWVACLLYSVGFSCLKSYQGVALRENVRGLVLDQAGNNTDALRAYEHATKLAPDYIEPRFNTAVLHERLGRRAESIACYEEILRRHPGHAPTHNNLGNIFEKAGRVDEAIQHYEQALAGDPGFALAHFNLGMILQRRERLEEAATHLTRAVELNPQHAQAHYALGALLQRAGRSDAAIAHYRAAIDAAPAYIEAHNNLANVLVETGETEQAVKSFERALQLSPEEFVLHFNLARTLLKLGREDEAIRHLNEVVRLKPDFAQAHYELSLAFRTKGDANKADDELKEAQRLIGQGQRSVPAPP